MKAVTLEHVRKEFGSVVGVDDVDVQIQPGEFFTFLGPSGCGKTTTLRMIAGFYFPTRGRILFGEQNVSQTPPHKRHTGMVFQNYALFPHMTVGENIAFGLQVRKQSRAEIREKVERAQKLVHLDGYGSRRIDQLSGGQQQRVALARALVIEPNILLLDEPLSNLDAKLREETRHEIKRLQLELGITTIYVTHDQAEAMSMSDRIMVMQGGVVQQIGRPHEIYNQPRNRFVASFIGETNLWQGHIEWIRGEEVGVRIAPDILLHGYKTNTSLSAPLQEAQRVTVSVRPEALRLREELESTNIIQGQVKLAEFTGLGFHYLIETNNLEIKSTFVNQGSQMKKRDEQITLHIPREALFFLESEGE